MEEITGATAAVIPAGGVGRRFGPGAPKQFMDLAGWPVLAHTVNRFDQTLVVDRIVVVAPYRYLAQVKKDIIAPLSLTKPCLVVPGGESRQESVQEGFMALDEDAALVVVHDAVRPLVKASTIEAVVEAAKKHGAAVAAVPVADTLKRVENGVVQETVNRNSLWQAQTPQAFERSILAEALAKARQDGFTATDESLLVERLGRPVQVVKGEAENIKITMPEDLVLAETLIRAAEDRG